MPRLFKRSRLSSAAALLAGIAAAVSPWAGAAADDTVRIDDAFVTTAADGRHWAVGNGRVVYRLGLSAADALDVLALEPAGGPSLLVPAAGDAEFAYDEVRDALGGREFRFLGAEAAVADGRAVLTLGFALRARDVVVERHYAVAPAAPTVEIWTTVEAGEPIRLRDPQGVALEVRARDAWWQRGHETPDDQGGPFSLRTASMDDGSHVGFGSTTLSSLDAMPWFGVGDGTTQVVVALAWSGSWTASLDGTAAGTRLQVGLPGTAIDVEAGGRAEFPHTLVTVTGTGPGDVAEAVGAWLRQRRQDRPYPALSTFNTWFPFGIEIDDALARRQMDSFAAIGGELFQLDAGWYPPVGARDRFDFSAGLGSWRVDADRFPAGLGALADHAHGLGLQFGVWIEPERVDMAMVGRPGLAETRFLAQADGAYQPGRDNAEARAGQICLGQPEAWAWVRDRLFAFLDDARPDYVKVDLNGWLTCNRGDHAHGPDGGNFAHVSGLYRLLDDMRARYPGLLLETVAGGARRLDLALLTRADAAWMDDRTAPAARVRHHLALLSRVVPPSALLSYLLPHPDEPLLEGGDLSLLARSRMPGALGLAVDFRGMSAADHDRLGAQLGEFQALRALRGQAVAAPLSEPVAVDGGGPDWDVLQEIDPATGTVVVFAFRNPRGARRTHVVLTHLRPEASYQVRSLDRGSLGTIGGLDLMTGGFDIDATGESASRVFIFQPR